MCQAEAAAHELYDISLHRADRITSASVGAANCCVFAHTVHTLQSDQESSAKRLVEKEC